MRGRKRQRQSLRLPQKQGDEGSDVRSCRSLPKTVIFKPRPFGPLIRRGRRAMSAGFPANRRTTYVGAVLAVAKGFEPYLVNP